MSNTYLPYPPSDAPAMTLRQYIAIQAMQNFTWHGGIKDDAASCVKIADALLAELERTNTK